jgi:hypothetical protein
MEKMGSINQILLRDFFATGFHPRIAMGKKLRFAPDGHHRNLG